jgi:PEP-CTERM motif
MPTRLRVALFASLFLVGLFPPLVKANSIPIGQISFITGGCNNYTCFKTWVSVGINSGGVLFDTRGLPYQLDMTGTFYVRDMSGAWGPAYGDGNIHFPDYKGQVLDLSYICTPCSGIMLKLSLNYPEELLINGHKVYPNTTLTAVLLPSNGQYFYPGDYSNATIYLTTTNATPEPSSLLLMGTGLISMAGVAKRRWRNQLTKFVAVVFAP